MHKQLYLYINALSDFGSRMNLIAVTALFLTVDDSPFWLMAYFLARQVGALLSSLVAGVLADRFDRRRCMIASDLVCGAAIVLVAVFPQPPVAVAAAFVAGMMYNVFQISFDASLADWFGESKLHMTNSRIVRLGNVVSVLGFAISGMLTDWAGYRLIIAFDALTFLFSAFVLTRMRWASKELVASITVREERTADRAGLRKALQEVSGYLHAQPFYLHMLLLALLTAFGGAAWNYGLPFLAQFDSAQQATLHGWMWTAIGAGGIVGSWLLSCVRSRAVPALLGAIGAFSLMITLAFACSQPIAIFGLLLLAGMAEAGVQLYQRTLIQTADNRLRGRVLGLQALLIRAGYLAGFLAAPFLLGRMPLAGMMLVVQAIVLVLAALLARPLLHNARQTLPK